VRPSKSAKLFHRPGGPSTFTRKAPRVRKIFEVVLALVLLALFSGVASLKL
jgi:hypothetical protein